MRTVRIIARIVHIAVISVLTFILACNLYVIIGKAATGEHPTLLGWSSAVVVSGSMSPAIEVDDMVILHRQDTYMCGDIIMYKDGSSFVTHRVEEVTESGYITKGDANNTVDPPVHADCVVGKTVFVIPKVGRLTAALQTPLGMCVLVLAGIGLVLAPDIIEKMRKKLAGLK